VRRPGDLDLVALGLGVAAAALGIAADTGPFMVGLAVALVIARLVRARTAPHVVCWIIVPLLLWVGHQSDTFLAATVCLFAASGIVAWDARGRPEQPTDVEVAVRVSLVVAGAVTAIALLAFGDIYM
jgi:hypothetical protein